MSTHAPSFDDDFASLLAAYDEDLAAGRAPDITPESQVGDTFREQLAQARECLELLERVWPRSPGRTKRHFPNNIPAEPSRRMPASLGRYRIIRELGHGGYGIVFLAFDPALNRDVALKVPRLEVFFTAELRRRFLLEAEAAAGLDHPNIVPIHEVSEHEGQLYFSMKLIQGKSLAEQLPRFQNDPRAVAALVASVARAVHHAHQRGVLHRDLKPANILVDGDDQPHVTDFGLAKRLEKDGGMTQTGEILGTPSYMAPEQAARGAVTVATDVYGLGAILYALLTGRPPFTGTTLEILDQVRRSETMAPRRLNPRVPRDLETICLKCLDKDPGKRYVSATALSEDLQRYLKHEPIAARPAGMWERAAKWARRRPGLVAGLAAGVLGLVAAAAGLAFHTMRLQEALDETNRTRTSLEVREARLRRQLYEANIREAHHFWEWGNIETAKSFLLRDLPQADGEDDLRGFEWHYLAWLLRSSDAFNLTDHVQGEIKASVFSADSRLLALASSERTIQVWDVPSRKLQITLKSPAGVMHQLAFAPGGKMLIGIDENLRLKAWDVLTGKEVGLRFSGEKAPAHGLALSGDGTRVAVSLKDNRVKVIETQTGKELRTFVYQGEAAQRILFATGGDAIAGGGLRKPWRLWGLRGTANGQLQARDFGDEARWPVALSWSARWLALGQPDGTIIVHDLFLNKSREFRSHVAQVRSLAFSPDDTLAVGGDGTTIQLLDALTGQTLTLFKGHTRPVQSLAFTPDNKLLASTSADGMVKIWPRTLRQGRQKILPAIWGTSEVFRISADGRTLAFRSRDRIIQLFDVPTLQVRVSLPEQVRDIWDFSISPDGKTVASIVEGEHIVRFWDTTTGKERKQLRIPGVISLAYSPNGQWLAISWNSGTVDVWDLEGTGVLKTFAGYGNNAVRLTFSRDSRLLAASYNDLKVWLFDMDAKKELHCFRPKGNYSHMEFAPDGKRLLTWGEGFMQIWDCQTGKEITIPEATRPDFRAGSAAFGKLGSTIANVMDGPLFAWNADTLARGPIFIANRFNAVGFTPDGSEMITQSESGIVKFWDSRTWKTRLPFDQPAGRIHGMAFGADGQTVVTVSRFANIEVTTPDKEITMVAESAEQAIRFWDVKTRRQVRRLRNPPDIVTLLTMSAARDGKTLAVGGFGGAFWLVDLTTGEFSPPRFVSAESRRIWEFWKAGGDTCPDFIQNDRVMAMTLTPDARLLATETLGGTIKVWQVATNEELATFPEKVESGRGLAFSPDGGSVAFNNGRRVCLWDYARGTLKVLGEHSRDVCRLEFSPDGKILASGGLDWQIKLWDVEAGGEKVDPLLGHTGEITSLSFTPDGKTLASASLDDTIKLWSVVSGQLLLSDKCNETHCVAFAPDGSCLAAAVDSTRNSDEIHIWPAPR
jgi:WD40 repeat protein